MAISKTHYELLRTLRERGALPLGEPILEIGQANFYGDFDPRDMLPDIERFVTDKDRRDTLTGMLANISEFTPYGRMVVCEQQQWKGLDQALLALAQSIYGILFNTTSPTHAIDLIGESTLKHDLNHPVQGLATYSTVINHGTAEHIFNIGQVFRTMHDATRPGGLMIHESPFTGWIDHGFYCLQPTLFYDLAAANGYSIELMAIEHLASRSVIHINDRGDFAELARRDQLPYNAMLFVAMRKTKDEPFRIPMQGVYSAHASESMKQSWKELR